MSAELKPPNFFTPTVLAIKIIHTYTAFFQPTDMKIQAYNNESCFGHKLTWSLMQLYATVKQLKWITMSTR